MSNEVTSHLEKAKGALLASVKASESSKRSRLPFNLAYTHEALQWRLCDLASSAWSCCERNEWVPAVILARSSLETAAAIHHCYRQAQAIVDGRAFAEVEPVVKRLALGRKDKEDLQPVNVLTCIQQMSKRTELKLEPLYEETSEYAHPNWFGSLGSYARVRKDEESYEFDTKFTDSKYCAELVENTLCVTLQVSLLLRQFMNDLQPALIAMCDKADVRSE